MFVVLVKDRVTISVHKICDPHFLMTKVHVGDSRNERFLSTITTLVNHRHHGSRKEQECRRAG